MSDMVVPSRYVLLDAGPLGMVTNPKESETTIAAARWIQGLPVNGWRVVVPEITDYEVRREPLRSRKLNGIARLDALKAAATYLPLTTAMMLLAAVLWAQARQQGIPTADPKALDADMILAAQARLLASESGLPSEDVVIATTNVGHLSRFAQAMLWSDIT